MFAELLRRARAGAGITQEQVVERLAALGETVGQTTVSAWECGGAVPRGGKRLAAIAAVYRINIDLVVQAAALPRPRTSPGPADPPPATRPRPTAADMDRLEARFSEIAALVGELLTVLRDDATR